MVFGLTYAIGTVMDKYIVAKLAGRTLTADEIKQAWKSAKKSGEAEGKRREQEIRRDANNR